MKTSTFWLALLLSRMGPLHSATVLTLGYTASAQHPRAVACQYFAGELKARSQGRISVDVVGGSLGDDVTMVRALQNGTLDLSANSQGPVAAVVPEYNAFGLPFLFSGSAQALRLLDGPLGQELARRSAAKGLVVLGFWDNGIRHLSNSIRPVKVPADLAGLRIRIPADEVAADLVQALGGTPEQVNFSDLHNALGSGFVDGQEIPLVNFQEIKLYEVQKYISLTGHKFEMTPFLIRQGAWQALAPADQDLVRRIADQATAYQRDLTRKAEREALDDLVRRGVRIDKVDARPFAAATAKVRDKWAAGPVGDFVRRVIRAARGPK